MTPSVELVGAILEAVRPRDQHLAPPRGALLVRCVAVEELATRCGVCPQAAADLHYDRPLVAVRDLDLLAGGGEHAYPGTARTDGAGRRRATTKDQSPIATATSAA